MFGSSGISTNSFPCFAHVLTHLSTYLGCNYGNYARHVLPHFEENEFLLTVAKNCTLNIL